MTAGTTDISGRMGRSVRIGTTGLAAGAIALTAALAATPAAHAGGDRHGGDDHGDAAVVLGLSDRTADELTDGANRITARGRADKVVHDGTVYLSLPMRGGDDHDGWGRGGDDDGVVPLAGAVAFTGSGPTVQWGSLRVNLRQGLVSARVNGGARVAVLRADDRDDHDGHHRARHGDDSLRLTAAGARSLNRAAAGAPFDAGDVFAGDSHGC